MVVCEVKGVAGIFRAGCAVFFFLFLTRVGEG